MCTLLFPFTFQLARRSFGLDGMLEEEEEGVSQEELLEINRKLDDMYAFYDLTNRQDIQACEMVQDGVRVRDYQGGRMAFQFEETIHRFQNMVADYVRREK